MLEACNEYPIIAVTESWLESSISDFELFPQTYSFYRSDRDFSSTSCMRGGGVLIAVAEHLSSTRVELDGDKSLSQLRIDVVVVKPEQGQEKEDETLFMRDLGGLNQDTRINHISNADDDYRDNKIWQLKCQIFLKNHIKQ
nr:unnamed protein product [Callosobruchus analis]